MDDTPRMLRLAMAQMNAVVGDIEGNRKIMTALARRLGSDLAKDTAQVLVFPELSLTGYPPEDLLMRSRFHAQVKRAMEQMAREVPSEMVVLVGAPHLDGDLYNAAWILNGGHIAGIYHKQHLPNYAVFDEYRWFKADHNPLILELESEGELYARVGLTICEDIWQTAGPAAAEAAAGAEVIINLSASPWRMKRGADRERLLATRATDMNAFVALCNLVGGQDELVFDGASPVFSPDGKLVARGAHCAEDVVIVDLDLDMATRARLADARMRDAARFMEAGEHPQRLNLHIAPCYQPGSQVPPLPQPVSQQDRTQELADLWRVLRLGLGDYVRKNGFSKVLLGLSGGIDSALVLALAVDELGADAVQAFSMPSRYNSEGTKSDARTMAERLGIGFDEIPISDTLAAYETALAPHFEGCAADVTEENLQARIRGNLLMAYSNKFGHMVLATGNKSEYSVGYATLYGDMSGGFAPLKDVPKLVVFELSEWVNEQAAARGEEPIIPPSIIHRPPSAELAEDQQDSDALPPYEILDPLLDILVDQDLGVQDAVRAGFDEAVARRVQKLVDRAEYKRRQAPPGIRISARAFGRDRRVPITNHFEKG